MVPNYRYFFLASLVLESYDNPLYNQYICSEALYMKNEYHHPKTIVLIVIQLVRVLIVLTHSELSIFHPSLRTAYQLHQFFQGLIVFLLFCYDSLDCALCLGSL